MSYARKLFAGIFLSWGAFFRSSVNIYRFWIKLFSTIYWSLRILSLPLHR